MSVNLADLDRLALKYAGLMGHNYCLVGTVRGERRTLGESDSLADVRRWAAEQADKQPRIYQMVRRGRHHTYSHVA